jgi:lipopolysaccharide biosynthesis glycosyltransferase
VCATSDIERRGIHVLHVPDASWDFLVKFHAFTPFFRRWKQSLCLDLDIVVQGPLQKIFDGLGPRLPAILGDLEDGSILGGLKQFDPKANEHAIIYEDIERRFPYVTQRMMNAGFLFYDPASMPDDTIDRLRALANEFAVINPQNADQMLLNLLLYQRMELAGKDYVCFFGCDYECNRVFSEFRKWRGDEVPVILHYTRWHAPWIKKTRDAGGYEVFRLGRIARELYLENLAAFEQEFPIQDGAR